MNEEAVVRHSKCAVFSRRMAAIEHIRSLLGVDELAVWPTPLAPRDIDLVVGWGNKRNTRRAKRFAARRDLPFWRVEDGFLRSVGLGVHGDPPLSVIVDDVGIYYDAREPSRLEQWLAETNEEKDRLSDPVLHQRARDCIDGIVSMRLSKYNQAPPGDWTEAEGGGTHVLVVDQTRGDLSIEGALASARSFETMLETAKLEHPEATIWVKTHPDVLAGKKRGHLAPSTREPRVRWVTEERAPLAIIERVDHVYVVSSQLGFEALMAGKPVTCFGAPFYAGWGLTDDRLEIPRRGVQRSLAEVFAAAYLLYPRYRDPDTGERCEAERVIEHLGLQRRMFELNTGRIYCFGFRFYKHNYIRSYLRSPGNEIVFASDAADAEARGFDKNCRALVWGQRETEQVRRLTQEHGVKLWRMEDGFLRSIGLGSDMVAPASLVVDRDNIYYDPSHPSELEKILLESTFSDDECARAAVLRERIVTSGLSKYNVGQASALEVPTDRPVVLVPGQVEDDASIQLGCRSVKTNLGLLEAARSAHPGAYVIYKPHPDVLSGNRQGRVALDAAREVCDHVEAQASLSECLAVCQHVHTMTSLVGFEALLRDKKVVVYGQPFYASWGLTDDRHPLTRRGRMLSLDELVAGTLIRYPRYLNGRTGRFTTPEAIVTELLAQRQEGAQPLHVSWARRQARKLVHIYKGLVREG